MSKTFELYSLKCYIFIQKNTQKSYGIIKIDIGFYSLYFMHIDNSEKSKKKIKNQN